MSEDLPEGWYSAELDLLRSPDRPIIYGIIKPGPHVPDGVPYVRVVEMKDGTIDPAILRCTSREKAELFRRATLRAGDLLISKDGTIGRVAVVPPELEGGNITQHLVRVSPHPSMYRDYLVWAIRSPEAQRWLLSEKKGVALQGVNVADFRRLPIPLPPRAEQRRIVARVEELLTEVNVAKDRLAKLPAFVKRFRQSVLAAACSGKLSENWSNGADSAPQMSYSGSLEELPELPDFPSSWILESIEQVSTSICYGCNDKANDVPDGVPMLRMGNIQDGMIDLSDLKYIPRTATLGEFQIQRGDILFNRTNSPELVGKAAVYDSEREAVYASYLIRVRTNDDRALPDYIAAWINGPWGRAWARRVRTDGVSQSNINATKLARMPIPMPSLDEQRQIVSRMKSLLGLGAQLELALTAAQRRVEALGQAILARAFRGELVPTEAELARAEGRDYETAEQLLARSRSSVSMIAPVGIRSPAKKSTVRPRRVQP